MTDVIFTKEDQPANVAGYKTLKLEDGRDIEIKVMKTPEELYGPAYPTGLKVTDADVDLAKLIASNMADDATEKKPTEILISYLRGPSRIIVHPKEETDDDVIPSYETIGTGTPNACMVAFRLGDDVLLGWSVPNSSGEPMPYSKEKARVCAILRGMNDSITMVGKKCATNSQRNVIPVSVSKGFQKFTDRAMRYFKQDFDNYFPNYTKG